MNYCPNCWYSLKELRVAKADEEIASDTTCCKKSSILKEGGERYAEHSLEIHCNENIRFLPAVFDNLLVSKRELETLKRYISTKSSSILADYESVSGAFDRCDCVIARLEAITKQLEETFSVESVVDFR